MARTSTIRPLAAAPLFAALGDATRLALVSRLARGGPQSVTTLAEGAAVSRQAISKHLRALERVGLARGQRSGRERVFELRPDRLADANRYLDLISLQWGQAIGRLKAMVEETGG